MKSFKVITTFCALLALLNTIDVHALTHAFNGDDHNQIENCQNCEEFVVSTNDDALTVPQFWSQQFINFNYKPTLFLNTLEIIFINQEKHLGNFHNKPPPFIV